jgi:hypothetical protein
MIVPATIGIEWQTIGDPATMFRLRIDDKVVGENLTAAQAHLLVGEILERIVLPNKKPKSSRPASMVSAE